MNCEEAQNRWHEQLDAGRPDAELEEHLRGCVSCREYAAQMALIADGLDKLRLETEAITSQTSGPALREQTQSWLRITPRRVHRLVRVAAAVVVLIGGGILYQNVQRSNHTQQNNGGSSAVIGMPQTNPRVGITLRGGAAEKFMAVARHSSEPDVQLYWLYSTPTAAADE